VSETRKLATILALDIVGYSRATERDDAAAAAAIHMTRDLLTEVSAARGGRIFSSAGDGFMLEFPTATAGLEAALAVSEACKQLDPPLNVRIGLHSGEVLVEADGDLLGHAVNIAARLQQRAGPGEIVLSEDVRRSARGALTDDLVSLGDVKLDKMSETLDIYAANAERRRLPLFLRGRRARFAAIGAALLAAGVLGAVLVLQPSRDVRTAVFALQAPAGDAELVSLARGVTNEIVDTLHQIGIETASSSETSDERSIAQRGRALGAAFTIEGDLIPEGDTVRASVRLSDVNGRQTLWAQSFERPSARAAELRLEVASVAVAVMQCAVEARRGAPQFTPQTLSMLLRSCEPSVDYESEAAWRLLGQVAEAVPDSSFVQGRFADFTYLASTFEPPGSLREQLVQQATMAADRALRLDPANGDALLVKTLILSETLSHAEWEAALLSALRRAPDNPGLNRVYAIFLRTHGRPREAVSYLRRALAREPLSPGNVRELVFTLASVGGDREAIDLLADTEARWPGNEDLWWERFRINLWFGSRAAALRMLDEAPSGFTTAQIQCFRLAAIALETETGAARRQVMRGARECWPSDRFLILTAIGEVDAAFAASESMLAECQDVGAGSPMPEACIHGHPWRVYFYPMTAPMRRDQRFMPLMHRAGLVEYWLETDRWPDFCEDPSLPYDCRQEARRISGVARSQ